MMITELDRGFNPSDQPLDSGRPKAHWTACQVFSKRLPRIRTAFEDSGRGTFVPTYAKVWHVDGKRSAVERMLLPGYILVRAGDDWGELAGVEGVIRVLANNGRACRIRDDEMTRLVLAHATGEHNEIERSAEPAVRRRRRRRPRPGRRWRMRQASIQPNTGA